MTWNEFYYQFFSQDKLLLFYVLIINLLVIFFIFKKDIFSLFDPLNILLLNMASCISIICYLKFKQLIDKEIFYQIIFINFSFIVFLKLFLFKIKIIKNKKIKNRKFFFLFYNLHLGCFFIVLITYIFFVGLNTLEDKLTAFQGLGLLNYFTKIVFPGQIIMILVKRNIYKNKSILDFGILAIIFFLFFISGGKTAIITYYLYFSYLYYIFYKGNINLNFLKNKKKEKIILILSFFSIVILFKYYDKNLNFFELVDRIYFRIISTGDIYYMIYPNNNFNKLEGIPMLDYYLYSFIRPILKKILDYKQPILGIEVMRKIFNTDITGGANSRADVILQMNLGYFGALFSILNSFIIAKIRKLIFLNFLILYIISIIFINVEYVILDFQYFAFYIFALFLVLGPMYVLTLIIYNILKFKEKNEDSLFL